VEGDALSAILVSNPTNGSLTLNAEGSFAYTPNADFSGTDSFTYRASDGVAQSNAATVTITVNPAQNLMASWAPADSISAEKTLTEAELQGIVAEAIGRWSDALNVDRSAEVQLSKVTFRIADLSGLTLGQAIQETILIDVNAAGYGWYVDSTPANDVEFGLKLSELELMAAGTSPAFGRMDLLTVVMHELGHVLGFEDLDPNAQNLMSGTLDAGTRRLNDDTQESPKLVQMDRVPGGDAERASMLWGTKQGQGFWLEDFLVNGAGGKYNPFDPTDKIKISIPGNNGGGGKKKLH